MTLKYFYESLQDITTSNKIPLTTLTTTRDNDVIVKMSTALIIKCIFIIISSLNSLRNILYNKSKTLEVLV